MLALSTDGGVVVSAVVICLACDGSLTGGRHDDASECPNAEPVLAAHRWKSNAELFEAIALSPLPYLSATRRTLDPTYGVGTFWKVWKPDELVATDGDPVKSPTGESVDFTRLPHADASFASIVFDPPYKLNGRPTIEVDDRYGVAVAASRDERHELMLAGVTECERVLAPGGFLLVKCQDQVNGGAVRWQTDLVTRRAEELELVKVDSFLFLGGREQPADRTRPGCPTCGARLTKVKAGRKCREHGIVGDVVEVLVEQEHARRNYSTLLVFEKPSCTTSRTRRAEQLELEERS